MLSDFFFVFFLAQMGVGRWSFSFRFILFDVFFLFVFGGWDNVDFRLVVFCLSV